MDLVHSYAGKNMLVSGKESPPNEIMLVYKAISALLVLISKGLYDFKMFLKCFFRLLN